MRGHVEELARAVAGGGDDFAVTNECSADWDLTALAGGFGFPQRILHGAR
jgi:hypothetical protein